MPPLTTQVRSYFAGLHSRIGGAELVNFKPVSLPCGWEPKPAECHKNVDHWVTQSQHQHLKAVRGWYIEGPDNLGQYRLIAHSLVDDDGKLYDITPIDSPPLRFLSHNGTKEDFDAMQPEWSWTFYPFIETLSNEPAETHNPWEQ